MSRLYITLLAPAIGLAVMPSYAIAQYYAPIPAQHHQAHQPGGVGVDLGLRNFGINPSVGAGVGQLGAGVRAGLGPRGIGSGVNTGVGPLGVSADAGLNRNGLGARGSAGIANTGAAFEAGLSRGGVGVGASTQVFGFGGGASLGFGDQGPGLGANLAFGPIGTLLIGSHRNSYPGAAQTAAHMYPNQTSSFYTPQNYGNSPYYQAAPAHGHRGFHQSQPAPHHVSQPVYAQPVYAQPTYSQPAYSQPQYNGSTCSAPWTC